MLQKKTDEQLYQDFLATKERDVMATIFRKHMSLVFGVCMKYIGEKKWRPGFYHGGV